MKKSLLALAVLGAFAGTASAQSSVTIYGLLDLSIAKNSCAPSGAENNCAINPGTPGNEAWTMQQSSSSRLGFRGNEDLGGGLSAQFQIEHRFTPDNGAVDASGIMWYGRSYVQLTSASAGSVYLGREYDPSFWVAVKSDPFGWDGVGQIGTMQNALFGAVGTGSSVRTNNTLGYKTPNLGGVTANVAVGLGEGAPNPRQTGFNVEYAAGPIYAGLGYERLAGSNPANDGNNLVNMAVHYNFGFAKLIGFYARGKTNGGDDTNKTMMIAATAPIGGGKLKAAYARLDPEGDNNDRDKLGLGYDYPLSKRTNVYFDVGLAKEDNRDNSNAYAAGVKHTF